MNKGRGGGMGMLEKSEKIISGGAHFRRFARSATKPKYGSGYSYILYVDM